VTRARAHAACTPPRARRCPRRARPPRTPFASTFPGLEVQEVRDGESNRWLKGFHLEADDVEERRCVLLDEVARWEAY
jgi:hypothetical protein